MVDREIMASAEVAARPVLSTEEPGGVGRMAGWVATFLIALSIHGGLFYYLTLEPAAPEPSKEAPAAVMIDMAPEVQQAFSQTDQALGQPMQEAAEQPPPPPDPPKPDPTPPVEDSPSAAVAPLPPKPPEKPVEPKPPVRPQPPKPKKPIKKPSTRAAPRTAMAPRSDQHAAHTTASSAGASNAAAAADWKSQVAAALNRVKRYPPGASSAGSPVLRVSVGASGAIGAASLVASSGSGDLDSEALAAVRRVGSFPPPPQGATTLTFRMNFRRH